MVCDCCVNRLEFQGTEQLAAHSGRCGYPVIKKIYLLIQLKNAQVAFSFSVAFYAPAVLLGCSQ
jgi:hypothetical protein